MHNICFSFCGACGISLLMTRGAVFRRCSERRKPTSGWRRQADDYGRFYDPSVNQSRDCRW